MDKNNQTSEEIIVSKSISTMAFWVVLLTSLSWIGAFMLQRKETAIKMLLIQIVLVAYGCYELSGLGGGRYEGPAIAMRLFPLWLCVWLWGLILIAKVARTNNGLNVKDMDKNNQASEEIVVSKRTSMMAFRLVLLTSLSWVGASMLQREKTAIVMLLIQILIVACGYYVISGGPGYGVLLFPLFLFPLWLCVWSWGLILTGTAALAHNELNEIARGIIEITVFLAYLVTIICILFCLWFPISLLLL